MYDAEQWRNREHVVLHHAAIVAYEMQYLCLCASGAVYHSVNLRTHKVEQLLYYRSIGAGRGEDELSCVDLHAFHCLVKPVAAAIDEFLWHSMVEGFRIFLCNILVEHVVACRCQSVASHSAVVAVLVCGFSTRRESYYYVARTYVGIVYHVATLHAACHCRVNNYSAHEVAHVGSLAACGVDANSHLAHLSQQFVGAVDNGRDHLAWHEHLVSSDSARHKNVIYRAHAEQVVGVHYQCVLCDALPDAEVACFLPVGVSER